MRCFAAALVLCVAALGQAPEGLLPAGVTLDAAGKLQWQAFEARPCATCKGEKTVPCGRCERAAEPCGFCTSRRAPCYECAGVGHTTDPFVGAVCEQCQGQGFEICFACDGARRIVTAAEEHACAACKATGMFTCPLCGGAKRLMAVTVDGRNVRELTAAQLDDLAASLRAYEERLHNGHELADAGEDPPARAAALLDAAERLLLLPAKQIERLRVAVAAAQGSVREVGMGWRLPNTAVSSYRAALDRHVGNQYQRVETARWLCRRNANGVASRPARRAADVSWSGGVGEHVTDKSAMYSLLGCGLLDEQARNMPDVVSRWLAVHPDAVLIEVASMPMAPTAFGGGGGKDRRLAYVWAVDKGENLGVHLVKQGCVQAVTMRWATAEIDIAFADYFRFMKDVAAAEADAKTAKRGIWATARHGEGDPGETARELEKQGKFTEALERYRAVIADGRTHAQAWLDVGRCLERLGRVDEALDAYDKALADGTSSSPYWEKARLLEQTRGLKTAVDWLEGLAAADRENEKFPHIIGGFHMQAGRWAEAIPHFERIVKRVCDADGIRFDAENRLIPNPPTPGQSARVPHQALSPLEDLATCLARAGQMDAAMKRATMGISVAQARLRGEGYIPEDEVEAGSVPCRLVAAQVYLSRGNLDEAARELRFAKIGTRSHGYTRWVKQLADLEARVNSARAAKK